MSIYAMEYQLGAASKPHPPNLVVTFSTLLSSLDRDYFTQDQTFLWFNIHSYWYLLVYGSILPYCQIMYYIFQNKKTFFFDIINNYCNIIVFRILPNVIL